MLNEKDAPPIMGGREWAMLLALVVLWGGSFFFNSVAMRELPSFTLVWLRVAFAAVILLVVLSLLSNGCRHKAGFGSPFSGWVYSTMFRDLTVRACLSASVLLSSDLFSRIMS